MKAPSSLAAANVTGGTAASEKDVEVVPCGQALSIVSQWLGMSAEEALAEAGPSAAAQAAVPPKRPQFLGLGAKYLPHHKAVETATALDNKLRRRLEKGLAARRQAAEEAAEEERGLGGSGRKGTPGAHTGQTAGKGGSHPGQRSAGGQAAKRGFNGGRAAAGAEEDDSEDEEEEEGKAAGPSKSRVGAGSSAAATIPTAGATGSAGPGFGNGVGPTAAQTPGVGPGPAAMGPGSKAAREALLYAPVGGAAGKGKGKKGKRQRLTPSG